MLNDSGPIFPAPNSTYKSCPLHDLIKVQWNLASLYATLPATFNPNDFGTHHRGGGDASSRPTSSPTPATRATTTSRASRTSASTRASRRPTVLAYWRADQANLVNEMKTYANFSYHIPWHRPINASHCSSIITFIGSHACPTVRKKYWYEIPMARPGSARAATSRWRRSSTNWIDEQHAAADRRDRELLQQRGSGDADRGAADQRRDRRLSARSVREAGGSSGSRPQPVLEAPRRRPSAARSAARALEESGWKGRGRGRGRLRGAGVALLACCFRWPPSRASRAPDEPGTGRQRARHRRAARARALHPRAALPRRRPPRRPRDPRARPRARREPSTTKDDLGRTALLLAARDAGSLELVRFLHAKGAAVDEPDVGGRAALSYAAESGRLDIVR